MSLSRKSQVEILGLVLVVIIVVIGLVFFIGISARGSTLRVNDFTDNSDTQGFLNAMLGTKTDCGVELKEIVTDCYGRNTKCSPDSCAYASGYISRVLENTLQEKEKPYRLMISMGSDVRIGESPEISYSGCDDDSEKATSGYIFLPAGEGTITVTLDICK